jgi:hypothetical protein
MRDEMVEMVIEGQRCCGQGMIWRCVHGLRDFMVWQ